MSNLENSTFGVQKNSSRCSWTRCQSLNYLAGTATEMSVCRQGKWLKGGWLKKRGLRLYFWEINCYRFLINPVSHYPPPPPQYIKDGVVLGSKKWSLHSFHSVNRSSSDILTGYPIFLIKLATMTWQLSTPSSCPNMFNFRFHKTIIAQAKTYNPNQMGGSTMATLIFHTFFFVFQLLLMGITTSESGHVHH